MVQNITCDACKNEHVPVDGSYDLKVRSGNTGLSMMSDLCQPCFMKMVETLGLTKVWKKWNANTKRWVTPE